MSEPGRVGPVLTAGEAAAAVLTALRAENAEIDVQDRGSYLRVSCPESCTVTRAAIESELGRPFVLPCDLEAIMPSFAGALEIDAERVSWRWRA
jgi:hypothetical protein